MVIPKPFKSWPYPFFKHALKEHSSWLMIFKSHSCIQKRLRTNLIFYQSIITFLTITIVIQGANIMKFCIVVFISCTVIDQQGIANA